jgi:hypothetical protein
VVDQLREGDAALQFEMKRIRNQLSEVLIPLDVAHHSGMISPTVPI